MEEEIKNMSKEELLEYLEDISQQLDNIALDQIQFAISELQFFKEEYKKLEEENKQLKVNEEILMKTKCCLNEDNSTNCRVLESLSYGIRAYEKTLKNSIPISVIQNKIDELKHRKSKNEFEFACKLKGILYLQELLEKRK